MGTLATLASSGALGWLPPRSTTRGLTLSNARTEWLLYEHVEKKSWS
jgi:hypothetical protein